MILVFIIFSFKLALSLSSFTLIKRLFSSSSLAAVKVFDCVNHNKLWKVLKEMGISDHLTCLMRNLYAGQEARVRTLYGTTDWFRIEKGV